MSSTISESSRSLSLSSSESSQGLSFDYRSLDAPVETSLLLPSNTVADQGFAQDVEAAALKHDDQKSTDLRKALVWASPALLLGIFLSAVDQTLIVSTYGTIASELEALQQADWIATAYFLTLTAVQPLYGKMSDIFGRKGCLMFAQIVFGMGCLWCGFANSMNVLIAARALTGIGGAGLGTVISIIYNDVIPIHERGPWTAYANVVFAVGSGVGGPIGGALTDSIGWRWTFFLQVPIAFVASLWTILTLRLPKHDSVHWIEKTKRIDFLGSILIVTAILTFLIGLDIGSTVSWSSNITIGCVCGCVVSMALFVLVESKFAANPIIPGRVVFQKSLSACFICNFSYYGCWMATLFYIPFYLQATQGYSATRAGVWLMPSVIVTLLGTLVAGYVLKWTLRYHRLSAFSFTVFDLGTLVIAICTGAIMKSIWGIWAGLIIAGFFGGVVNNCLIVALVFEILVANVTSEDQATATACYYLFRSLGSVVIISITSSIVQHSLRLKLHDRLSSVGDAENIARLVQENLENIQKLRPDVMVLVRDCYAEATSNGFVACAVAALGAVIAVWFIQNKKLGPKS